MDRRDFMFKVVKCILNLVIFLVRFVANILRTILITFFRGLKKKLRFSITFKITATYALIFFLILFFISFSVLISFKYFLTNQARKDIQKNAQFVSAYINENLQIPESAISDLIKSDNMELIIFDKNKDVVYSTNKDAKSEDFYEHINSIDTLRNVGKPSITLNKLIQVNDKKFYIQISKSLIKENLYTEMLSIILFIVNTIALLIVIIIGSRASKRMLLPVEKMTKTVKEISIHALDKRLDVSGSQDELKELAETFNDMIDRIQKSYEQQNQFVSDASHELRTPISVIQGYANLLDRWGKKDQAVLEESISAIKSEAESMKNLVEKLLFLAKADKNTRKIENEDFLLNELVEEVAKETRLIDSTHEILCETGENILVNADRKLIKEALRVFVDNSIKYTPEGGIIKLCAYLKKKDAVIVVEDTGIGIPKEDIPFIFNRFYRADKSRTKKSGGTGLGLSIAKWIIDKHNGRIEVQSTLGQGTKISVFLPFKTK